jgi:methylated-DNA-[protein]-cysteine S-methyltransferase
MSPVRIEPTPIGPLRLVGNGQALTELDWSSETLSLPDEDAVLDEAARQLRAYFGGKLQRFDLPLAPRGTPFQLAVWNALRGLPYGQTTTYAVLAASIGHPGKARAVGHANGRNPISIIIPCHRLIGANGHLTGYGGGLGRKRWLLDLEAGQPASHLA